MDLVKIVVQISSRGAKTQAGEIRYIRELSGQNTRNDGLPNGNSYGTSNGTVRYSVSRNNTMRVLSAYRRNMRPLEEVAMSFRGIAA